MKVSPYVNETTKYNYQEKDPTSLVFTLPSNEWVQESTEFMGDPLADTLSDRILGNYEKGKEVYLIKCSVGNYYDVDGNINISIDAAGLPMMFQKYQRVEPYIFTSKGEVPLSKDENGNPKVFEIIGTDFSYNGVPWQELTIQEYSRQS